MNVDPDSHFAHLREELVASHAQRIEPQSHHEKMPGVRVFATVFGQCYRRNIAQLPVIFIGDFGPALKESSEARKLRKPKRTLDIGKPVIETEVGHFVVPRAPLTGAFADIGGDAVIAKPPRTRRDFLVAGRKYSALARRDVLDRMRAETGEPGM